MEQKKAPKLPILIVDQRRKLFNSLELKLGSSGMTNLECCQDRRDMMRRLENGKYSALMIDLGMPGMNTFELLPRIFDKCPNIPVIAFNDTPGNKTTIACIEIAAVDYIFKHIETQELLRLIQKRLQVKDDLESEENETIAHINEVEYKTTIYFEIKPPCFFSLSEEKQGEEKEFLESFLKFKRVEVKIEKTEKKRAEEKKIELEDIEGLIFYYLAYKNYKALKDRDYSNWQEIPMTYRYRFSGNPNNNKNHNPEWKVLTNSLARNEKKIKPGNIRSWIRSLKDTLKSEGIEDIIDTPGEGRGKGYLLKGRVEFSLKQ